MGLHMNITKIEINKYFEFYTHTVFEKTLFANPDHVERRRVARRGSTHHAPPLDCTHFCEPAKLFTGMTQHIVSLSSSKKC